MSIKNYDYLYKILDLKAEEAKQNDKDYFYYVLDKQEISPALAYFASRHHGYIDLNCINNGHYVYKFYDFKGD